MGIIVKSINKNGNKIIDYVCDRDGVEIRLTRDELIDKINNKEVDNARIQVYKGQVIIRANIDKGSEKSKQTSSKKNTKTGDEYSSEVLNRIASEFKIDHIEAYSRFFFENNTSMVNKLYTPENIGEKINDMREMVRFCRLVAVKQANERYEKYYRNLDELEFMDYCIKNNLDYKGEPKC